jgi:hypothetical protein
VLQLVFETASPLQWQIYVVRLLPPAGRGGDSDD